jgi:hypothetical protein
MSAPDPAGLRWVIGLAVGAALVWIDDFRAYLELGPLGEIWVCGWTCADGGLLAQGISGWIGRLG